MLLSETMGAVAAGLVVVGLLASALSILAVGVCVLRSDATRPAPLAPAGACALGLAGRDQGASNSNPISSITA